MLAPVVATVVPSVASRSSSASAADCSKAWYLAANRAMVLASQALPQVLPYVLAFAAGNFLYVAMSDLIPDLHRGNNTGGVRQFLLIAAGIVTIALLQS